MDYSKDALPPNARHPQDTHLPADGYYELAWDVENPKKDRRSKAVESQLVFAKGMRFRVHTNAISGVRVTQFHGSFDYNDEGPLIAAIMPAMRQVPLKVGHVLDRYFVEASTLLAQMVEMAMVTPEQIRHAARKLYDTAEPESDTYLEDLHKEQWIVR